MQPLMIDTPFVTLVSLHFCLVFSRYDPKMNAWSIQAPMLSRRTRAVAAVLDGHLYVIGGNDGDMALSSGERRDKPQNCSFWFYFSSQSKVIKLQ